MNTINRQNSSGKHHGIERMVDEIQDVAAKMIGKAVAKTGGWMSEGAFVRNVFYADMYEVAASKIALKHARSPRVKEMARRMIDDHKTSSHHLKSAVKMNEVSEGVEIPDSIDARRKVLINSLKMAPPDKFDETYLDQQLFVHKEGIELLNRYRERGANAQLRSFAASTVPVMERHLRRVEGLRRELAD